jgi:hypothetical protein
MGNTRNCSRCGMLTSGECPACLKWFENRPDPARMAPSEREAEFRSWKKIEISFDKIHQRLEELVGRPVWTHEMGLNWEALAQEARERPCRVDMDKVLEPLAACGKKVILVDPDDGPEKVVQAVDQALNEESD